METEETLPFPPPLLRPTTGERLALATLKKPPSSPSLEQLTEARLAELRNEGLVWQTPPPGSSDIVLASEKTDKQIVLASAQRAEAAPVPLRWRGMPVSEQLQVYALRVARGEELEPYRGPILADPSQEPPWEAADTRGSRKDTRRGARLLLAFAGLGTVLAFLLPAHPPAMLPERTSAPAVSELPLTAAPAATPVESVPLASEPLPALREPPPAAAAAAAAAAPREPAAPRRAALSTAPGAAASKAGATPSTAPGAAASKAGATPSPAPTRSATAVAPSAASFASAFAAAAKRASEARAGVQHAPAPAGAPEPSNLLLDRPSF